MAKIEVFFDNDQDELDPDHIPILFNSVVRGSGPIYKINERNTIHWNLLMDNKQNTVSCVEREVRQHLGVGYKYATEALKLGVNAYLGFYYI